jgi:hypothetical protein
MVTPGFGSPGSSGFFGPDTSHPFLRELLDQAPAATYYSFQNRAGRPGGAPGGSPTEQRFFRNQYSDLFNQYQGALGSQIRGGAAPTLRFGEFLEDYPFAQQLGAMPPSLRGFGGTTRFTPPAQFRF